MILSGTGTWYDTEHNDFLIRCDYRAINGTSVHRRSIWVLREDDFAKIMNEWNRVAMLQPQDNKWKYLPGWEDLPQ